MHLVFFLQVVYTNQICIKIFKQFLSLVVFLDKDAE
jgi:hypothetical protein